MQGSVGCAVEDVAQNLAGGPAPLRDDYMVGAIYGKPKVWRRRTRGDAEQYGENPNERPG